jgi:DNA polymerase III subunit delta'
MPLRDITGHQRLVELLARSIAGGTLPPSLLFTGPAGATKRQTALAVAQTLNCLDLRQITDASGQPITDACGVCASCVRIQRGVHPDVVIVEPGDTGAIKIDQIREVVERAAYRPFEGRRRAVVIDEADALMAPAQNALLKTLEEPPSLSVFILVTTRPDMLLPTVRSRCIRLLFTEPGAEEVDVDAREIAQSVLVHASTTTDPGRRLEGAKELLAKTGQGSAADRDQLSAHLKAMASLLRDVEVLATGADAGTLANPDAKPALERLVPSFKGDRGLAAFSAIDRALEALDRNSGVKVVADWLVLQL